MKIVLWLENDWAFGRIANAIKKYSRHNIDIVSWDDEKKDMSQYDLLYTPVWYAKQYFQKHFNDIIPIVTSVHGVAELFNSKTNTFNVEHCETNEKQIESGRISEPLRKILNSQKALGCVSKELVNLLRPQIECHLIYTPCGVDTDEFVKPIKNIPLTVLCPVEEKLINKRPHGYDVKRWYLAKEIQERLPNIEFKFLPKRLHLNEVADFYSQGNVILCLSHSEGGPLGVLEAGASGVVPLSTPVGIIPEIIIPGFNGELLFDNIVENAVHILSEWKTSKNFQSMQINIQKSIIAGRSWKKLIENWDNLFEMSI
jgi:hypothetical protein